MVVSDTDSNQSDALRIVRFRAGGIGELNVDEDNDATGVEFLSETGQ